MKRTLLENSELGSEYSLYGNYVVDDELKLCFPNNDIAVTKKAKGQYQFVRKSQGQELRHRISVDSELVLTVAPITPLNLPEKKTNLLYLEFHEPLYIDKHVKTTVSVSCPIEIGIFITKQDSSHQLLDCFICDQSLCGFALYGSPTEGDFTKFSETGLDSKDSPYYYGKMDITIQNNLDYAARVGKIVFDASQQDVYYSKTDAKLDSLVMELDKNNDKSALVYTQNIDCPDFTLSPKIQSKNSDSFAMNEGYD